MVNIKNAALLILMVISSAAFSANAQAKDICNDKMRQIGVVTGGAKGTYKKIGSDLHRLMSRELGTDYLELCVKESAGSFANVQRLASAENAGIGIVQSDVIETLKTQELNSSRDIKELRLIAPLYNEEVHILANKKVKSLKDLANKKLNVGTFRGGSWVTATAIIQALNLPIEKHPTILTMDQSEALEAVLDGEIDAMIYVAGKPVELFADLKKYKGSKRMKNVHFVSGAREDFDDASNLPYFQTEITPQDYPWMEESVSTLAVKALLISYDFAKITDSFSKRKLNYFERRCSQFDQIGTVLRDNIGSLKNNVNGWHSKWQQVDLDAQVPGWERDLCSWNSISIATGSKRGTYFAFGKQIAEISKDKVLVEVKNSNGSEDNIRRMDGFENVAIGIVQSDVISRFKFSTKPEERKMADQLRLITPLYDEEVHLLANKSVRSFKDLDGKKVSAGREGSGTYMTAQLLSQVLDIEPEFIAQKEGQALQALKNGQVEAMLFVGGKPLNYFVKLNERFRKYPQDFEDIHVVSISTSDFPDGLSYVSSELTRQDYAWMESDVETIAIKALMVSKDFSTQKNSYYVKRCRQINDIYSSLESEIGKLKRNAGSADVHAKWSQVKLGENIPSWKLDQCAHAYKSKSTPKKVVTKLRKKGPCDKYLSAEYKTKNPGSWVMAHTSCKASIKAGI